MAILTRYLFVLVITLALPAVADDRKVEVHFAPGSSSKVISGTIKGYDGVMYMVGAKAGQTMTVTLKTSNGGNSFNIWAPGKTPGNDEALYSAEMEGNPAKVKLTADGEYGVQVYLMRSLARRNTPVTYKLTIAVGP